MQVKTFVIPVPDSDAANEEVNKFLRSVKVLEIRKEFVCANGTTFWTLCVTYLPCQQGAMQFAQTNRGKTDYKMILSETDFVKFSRLRAIRKKMAEKDAVPAFAIFTDAELAEICKLENINVKTVRAIDGIGSKRMEKYGEELINEYNKENLTNEADRESD